jgi:NADPH:quinone reductase-like Zn-dependent oxidoreductase
MPRSLPSRREEAIMRVTRLRSATALLCLLAGTTVGAAPASSQAIVQTDQGLALRTVATPQPAAGQVLVKVYAAGVNPVDWKRRARIPGFDVAGVVDSVGTGVTTLKPGDAVVARVSGGYAEYAIGVADEVVAKPKAFTYEQAAGIPVAGIAGYRAAIDAELARGQRVAIVGAAGGAGEVALQVAKARGAKIIAIGHSSQQQFLKTRGADEFVAYDKDDVAAKAKGVDAAINLVDGQALAALGYVKRGGRLTSIAGSPGEDQCAAADVTCVVVGVGYRGIDNGDALRALVQLADRGQYTVTVSKTFPLAAAAEAQQLGRTGQTIGKIILVVDPGKAQAR